MDQATEETVNWDTQTLVALKCANYKHVIIKPQMKRKKLVFTDSESDDDLSDDNE